MVSTSDVVQTGTAVAEKSVQVAQASAEVVQSAQSYLYTIAIAVVTLLVGLIIGMLVKKIAQRMLEEIKVRRFAHQLGWEYPVDILISSILALTIYTISVILFLEQLGVTSILLVILLTAGILLGFLMLFVAVKDIVPNLRGWLVARKNHPGQQISLAGVSGTISSIGIFETEVRANGELLYLPNALFRKQ